jgi:leucyl-tRNA synthetase
VHCDHCGIVPVPVDQLPVTLPEDLDLAAGETLAECPEFYETTCPVCGRPARRETDTMDTFTCSSWYYLRYCDPHDEELPFSKEAVDRWMPVDNYIGGIEHAILHLLYSRFWTKVLRDMGLTDVDEPFTNLLCQGMVKDANGVTMSKSLGNVVAPSSVIEPYGADTMRMTILFVAPPEKDFAWDEKAVAGCNRFLKRAWRIVWELSATADAASEVVPASLEAEAAKLNQTLHALGARCTDDFDRMQFNTAISAVMEIVNQASLYLNATDEASRDGALCYRVAHDVVAMLAPICPHWSEELFHEALGRTTSVYDEPWPTFDAAQAKADEVQIAVQLMGKVRAHVMVSTDSSKEALEHAALDALGDQIVGKTVRKVIVVPGRLVNVVAN